MTYLRFGIKLKLLRLMLGMTQAQAAQKVGMKLKDYQRVEEGQHEPRSGTLLQIAERILGGGHLAHFDAEDMSVEISTELVDLLFTRHRQ